MPPNRYPKGGVGGRGIAIGGLERRTREGGAQTDGGRRGTGGEARGELGLADAPGEEPASATGSGRPDGRGLGLLLLSRRLEDGMRPARQVDGAVLRAGLLVVSFCKIGL